MTQRILVVEDEPAISDAVSYALREAGYEVAAVGDGSIALEHARTRGFDLMILDLLLPGVPGLEVCARLRGEGNDLPIVMLTARAAELERVEGLDTGADDYVTKPFSTAEVVSRVRSLLRRRDLDRVGGGEMKRVGDLHLDVSRHTASIGGKPLLLTRSEFRLISLLASQPGKAFTREELIKHLWESDFVGDPRAIDVHVSNLRRKLETDSRRPQRLLTVRGVGYKLVAPRTG